MVHTVGCFPTSVSTPSSFLIESWSHSVTHPSKSPERYLNTLKTITLWHFFGNSWSKVTHLIYVSSTDSRKGFRIHLIVREISPPLPVSHFLFLFPTFFLFFPLSLSPIEYESGSMKPWLALMALLRPGAKSQDKLTWEWRNRKKLKAVAWPTSAIPALRGNNFPYLKPDSDTCQLFATKNT